jgi:hypothetical protein
MSNVHNGDEFETKRFADELIRKYKAQKAAYPHLDSICIDYIEGYPTEARLEKVTAYLAKTHNVSGNQWQATSGRAGCIWVSAKR